MPLQADLVSEVRQIFGSYSTHPATIPSNKGNLYELYVFLMSFQVLKGLDPAATILLFGRTLVFRCSPGVIDNATFSYVSFSKAGNDFELRNGIEVIGHNMYHEIDIGIFKGVQIDKSRPQRHLVRLSVECKNHGKLGTLKGESRKYLGCITDLCKGVHNVTTGCIHCGIGFEAAFATPLSAPATHPYFKYLTSYELNPMFDLKPGSTIERAFIRYLTAIYHSL